MQAKLSKFFSAKPAVKHVEAVEEGLPLPSQPVAKSVDIASMEFHSNPTRTNRLSSALQGFFDEQRNADHPAPTVPANLTPLEKQVASLRTRHPDSLLMVECGYRMRFFGNDARIASTVLGIYSHHSHSFLVASIPTHRALIHTR